VHGRCCTPGKLETNVRAIGQRGAQEGDVSGSGARVQEENREVLEALAGSKLLKEFERAFTAATGLPLALLPVESFRLPFSGARNEAPFCALMSRQNRTCGACLRAQAMAADRVKAGPCTTVCYAGLSETVVPVRLGNRLIGFLRTGQVFR
jgi:ligand-binding sensor protein